jgi:hypothetical protein
METTFPKFVCALCGKDFPSESHSITHILHTHQTLVIVQDPQEKAIPYSEYLKSISQDVEYLGDDTEILEDKNN